MLFFVINKLLKHIIYWEDNMKKIYSLKKEILFDNNIYDILSIAIDKKFSLDEYAIKGKFKVTGEYLIKENEKDDFDIDIPYLNYIEDIYDISKIKIDIDDFYYEIKDSNILVIHIDIVVDGLEEKERCIDITDEEIIDKLSFSEPSNDIEVDNEVITDIEEVDSQTIKEEGDIILNKNIEEKTENYVTYKVCIVRENDTLETICEKYSTSVESLKKYNVINELKIGDKIIVPYEKD